MSFLGLAVLLALGDAAAGRGVFVGKGGCVNCHSVENRGGSVGPDLSEIGLSRSPESLAPIEVTPVPEEIQPLIGALNGLLARLAKALAQQRQFIADAAHELRTPLTALLLQLQLAERARDEAEREKAHAMLREGIARAAHVVEQLLALAREDPDSHAAWRRPTKARPRRRELRCARCSTGPSSSKATAPRCAH